MKILVLGSGMMGQAITYDLCKYSNCDNITIADKYNKNLKSTYEFLNKEEIDFKTIDVEKTLEIKIKNI